MTSPFDPAMSDHIGAALESITDGFLVLAPDWTITYLNPQGAQLLSPDRDASTLTGDVLWHALPELRGSGLEAQLRRARQQRQPASVELYYPPAQQWLNVRVWPSRAGLAASLHPIGMAPDIPGRTRAPHAPPPQQDQMQAIANSIPQPAWIARFDGTVLWYNERWYEYTGLSRERVPAAGWEHACDAACLPALRLHWQQALRHGAAFEMELPIRGADGQFRWFLSRAHPVRDRSGRITRWFGTSTDIDQQKRRPPAPRAEAEAERSSLLKDEFLATVSHELRTPLTAILGWAQVLRRGKRDEAALHRGLQTIERNAKAQAQLIEDLLDISRITSGNVLLDMQLLSPLAIIDAAMAAVRPAADAKAITLRRDFSPTGMVTADPGRLQQVIWNLLSNAIKFTPNGGAVTVCAGDADGHVSITVGDTGIGIGPEFIEHVFERFRQADSSTTRRHGGLGLGLSIVKHLVQLHGGIVSARSAGEGLGASFTIQLPRAGGAADQRQQRSLGKHWNQAGATSAPNPSSQ